MAIDKFDGEHRWLSNFFSCPVHLSEDEQYPSVEAAYQAAKTMDPEKRKRFQTAKPAEAKRWGKILPIRPDWNTYRLGVMEDLLRQKFSVPFFAEKLLATGEEELIEGNWWGDTFWGVCKGEGENNLGKLLMKIRKELRCAATSSETRSS